MNTRIIGRHRAPGDAVTRKLPLAFVPRHCAGTECFHAHPGEIQQPLFESVDTPAPTCDRKFIHGSHHVLVVGGGDFLCPGSHSADVPPPRLKRHAARVRAAITRSA